MARTLVIGLTESGKQTTVNEDTFSLGGRVYPDMITGSEEQTGNSTGYNQLYVVTQGVGGPGAGDLAGRIIQRTASDLTDLLGRYQSPDLNFEKFSLDLIKEAHSRVLSQIKPREAGQSGASMALLLIDANAAYALNVGETDIFLFREGELFHLSCPTGPARDRGGLIGDRGVTLPTPDRLTTKKIDLKPGDIITLASRGFRQGYHPREFIADLASPDAFAASIRQAQIHSRQGDDSQSGTILAVKIRDLELTEPSDGIPGSEIRKSIYHNGLDQDGPEPARGGRRKKSKGEDGMAKVKKLKRKRNLKTFFLFLLLGFLIGMAAILFVWFLILR